jgi:hypothetical protein
MHVTIFKKYLYRSAFRGPKIHSDTSYPNNRTNMMHCLLAGLAAS